MVFTLSTMNVIGYHDQHLQFLIFSDETPQDEWPVLAGIHAIT